MFEEVDDMADEIKLIVTIVRKGFADGVVDASREAGAEGGTILQGRGTGIHEKKALFGIPIHPEKEIVLTLVPEKLAKKVLDAIIVRARLDEPGNGVGFMVDVDKMIGVVHHIKKHS